MRHISTRVLGEIIAVRGMMRNMSMRVLGEITAVTGILISLIFVGLKSDKALSLLDQQLIKKLASQPHKVGWKQLKIEN